MAAGVETVAVSGLRVAYRRAGQGQPLVLLHGGFLDSREWRAQLNGLSDEFDVIAMDCLGCGQSDDPPEGFTLRDYADNLAGFLAALGCDGAHIGGLSFGSMYALVLYRFHPELPRSLILAGAYAGWGGSLPRAEVARRVRWVNDVLDRPVAEWGPDFLATVYRDQTPPALLREAMDILEDLRPSGFRPVTEAFFAADLRDVLPRITVPTLLIYGDADARSPRHVAQDLHQQIRGSRLVVLPDAGHGVNEEAPEAFNAVVRDFLTGLAG